MTYEKEILDILKEADAQNGLSLSAIVRHVCNITNCDFFNARPYEEVYLDVQKFLRKESSFSGASIEKTEKRGYYRLNTKSQKVQQLLLEFSTED